MSQKNETSVLVLTLLITLGLIGILYWWLARNFDIGFSPSSSNQNQLKSQTTLQSISQSFASVQKVPSGLFSYGVSNYYLISTHK